MIFKGNIRTAPKTSNEAGKILLDIIKAVKMKVAVGPISYYCYDEGNRGITAMAIIETSHVVLHVWDEPNPAQLQFDLYSCQDFDQGDVLDILDYYFGLVEGQEITLDRNFEQPYIKQVNND